MTCSECGRVHVIDGTLLIDEVMKVPAAWAQVLVEMMCKHGKLRVIEAPRFDEPDEPGS